MKDIPELENMCCKFLGSLPANDPAHDIAHVNRVVTAAKALLKTEPADEEIVIASAWLHDCVVFSKNDPDNKSASKLSAEKAAEFLSGIGFPGTKIRSVIHAIEAHSYSAGIKPETIEAKIVQDADRLDALGAVGVARCCMVGGMLNRSLYNPVDPFCDQRSPDDRHWTLDHFFTKLFKLPETMHTESAKSMARERVAFMKGFLEQMRSELGYPR